MALCQESPTGTIQRIKAALNWRPLVFIGTFSYSIYLIHDPILRLVCTAGEYFNFSALSQYIVLFIIGVPFAVFCGYLLYLAVERHFIKAPRISAG
jgi:peptidoglycan/LPS O-acetylase OafA/YrhL